MIFKVSTITGLALLLLFAWGFFVGYSNGEELLNGGEIYLDIVPSNIIYILSSFPVQIILFAGCLSFIFSR